MLITFSDNYVNNFWCLKIYESPPPQHELYLTVYLTVPCEPVLDIEDDPLISGKTMKWSILVLQN